MKDSVCIVTGAGSGIGKATSIKLAALGARIVLSGRTSSKLEAVRKEIDTKGGLAETRPCDVSDVDETRSLVEGILRAHGRVDVLINSAGFSSKHRTTLSTTLQDAEAMMGVNLRGPFFLTQAVLPSMLECKKGTIVNVSSLAAISPSRIGGAFYSAVKSGLLNFTRYLNIELENSGVRACCILPGEVDTPTLKNRPVPPSPEARATMLVAGDVADAVLLAVTSPPPSLLEEITVRPSFRRDLSAELMDPSRK